MNEAVLNLPGDYGGLLQDLKSMGYSFVFHEILNPLAAHVVLRHDVDASIEYAVEVAECEYRLDIKSTYFILLTSDLYNPFSTHSRRLIRTIEGLGHRIGLHTQAAETSDNMQDLITQIHKERDQLSYLTNNPVSDFSFHRPAANLSGINYSDILIPGMVNFYKKALFKDIEFVSDSRGGWYRGHPFEREAVKNRTALQLLTHPIWWIEGAEVIASQRLDSFLKNRKRFLEHVCNDEFSIMSSASLEGTVNHD